MSDLINDLRALHKHWDGKSEFMYTARKCKEAAELIEAQQARIAELEKKA